MTHTPRLHRVRDQQALADEKTCRLNKAAPDMLEALEGIIQLIESYVSDLKYTWEYRAVCEAIKKARGEE